jgi:hypothetical protein
MDSAGRHIRGCMKLKKGVASSVEKRKKLHVDHDHTTNKMRTLLCHNCNSVLGYARENPAILRAGIEYLLLFKAEKHKIGPPFKLSDGRFCRCCQRDSNPRPFASKANALIH